MYARFENGLCYGFSKGRTLQLFEMSDLSMVQRIAKEMARMHAMPLSAELSAEDECLLLLMKFLKTWILKRRQQGASSELHTHGKWLNEAVSLLLNTDINVTDFNVLYCRYREAGRDPPIILLYTDRDYCCSTSSHSKLMQLFNE